MPPPLSLNDPFTLFLFVVATVMMLGYAAGRWANQRRTRQISAWLEPGVRSLGGTPLAQPVSRSAFRFQTTNARQPFRTVTTSVVLISREVLPTWLWERLNGRHDLLVVHVTFRRPPTLEAEIVDPGNELGRRGEAQAQEFNWLADDVRLRDAAEAHLKRSGRSLSPRLQLYHAPGTSPARVQAVADQVESSPFMFWRVALRRNAPHMLLSMPVPDLDQIHSNKLARLLIELSKLTQSPPGEHVS